MLERFYRELLGFLARTVGDRDAAADLAQESYARVLAVHRSGVPIPDPRALLFRTARNLVIDRHRRNAIREHEDLDDLSGLDEPIAPRHLEPEEAYAYGRYAERMLAAIESMPLRCREAFILNRFEGLSHQEVADRMGISKNMVAQHVVRAVLICRTYERNAGAGPVASAGSEEVS